jgi:hypothetical protein
MEDIQKLKISMLKVNQNISDINDFLLFLEKCYNSLEMRLFKLNKKIPKKKNVKKEESIIEETKSCSTIDN